MDTPSFDLRPLFAIFIIGGMLVVGLIWGAVAFFTRNNDKVIVMEKPLKPQLVITVKDGVADTTYVYQTPK